MLGQLFSAQWIERKSWFAFVLGASYAVLGIGSALLLFPRESGLAAVAFTSLLTLPALNRLISIETKQAARERRFDLTDPFKNHRDIFGVYIFLFLGVFAAFSIFSILLPDIAANRIFAEQIDAVGIYGSAVGGGTFASIFSNNAIVFLFALGMSLIYGSGSIFILIWNSSVWGVVFGTLARDAALATSYHPFAYLFLSVLAVAPHLITEAGAYIMAAISGAILAKATILEKPFSDRYVKVLKDALMIFAVAIILLVAAAYVESNITSKLFAFFGL